ncbi:MAG: hypothetical protein ACTSUL_07165 [Promethearchaeota archaeon]
MNNKQTLIINEIKKFLDFKSSIISIWGEIGTGKSTLALQIIKDNVLKNSKILYIYSKYDIPIEKIQEIYKNEFNSFINNVIMIQILDFEDLYNFCFDLELKLVENIKQTNNSINFIVIDSISDLYDLSLIKNKKEKNVSLNYKLNIILATLTSYIKKFSTQIMVINSSKSIFLDKEIMEIQSGGKVMDYWIKQSIKIERTSKINQRCLILFDNKYNKLFEFYCHLTSRGFLSC